MANPEHLKILRQGVRVWSNWRDYENIDEAPDLSGADFRGSNLRNFNLMEANLNDATLIGAHLKNANLIKAKLNRTKFTKANLSNANINMAILKEADLSNATLTYADLRHADLTDANLNYTAFARADLSYTNLSGADLSGAYLNDTNLTGVSMKNAILDKAVISRTLFNDVDLCEVKDLDKVEHRRPSTVGIDTIYKFKGNIPEVFLRGAGVPQSFIDNMKFTIGAASAIEFYSCFISYSSKDESFAKRLHADLQQEGVRCWFAPEDMKIGDKIRQKIDESIRMYDKLMLILSKHSIDSDWVEDEVEAGYEKEQGSGKTVLFPVRLDDAVKDKNKAWAAKLRRQRHIGDFTNWKDHDAYKKGFDRLLRDLKADEEKA